MSFANPDYTPLLEMTFDPEEPIRSEQGLALYGNPIAIIRGNLGAPITKAAWHPYNAETWGDGADGLVYNYDIHGAVSGIDLGAVIPGYEYRVVYEQIRIASSPSRVLFFDVVINGIWRAIPMITMSNAANELGQYTLYRSSGVSVAHMSGTARTSYILSSEIVYTSDTSSTPNPGPYTDGIALSGYSKSDGLGMSAAGSAIQTQMRLRLSGSTLSAGKIWLHKRKVSV